MNIAFDLETEKLIQAEIDSGRFPDATSLVGTALRHFVIAREFGEVYRRQEIDDKIARGASQLDRGEGVDGDEFFEKLRRRGEEIRRQRT